jgi:hypothetical protein
VLHHQHLGSPATITGLLAIMEHLLGDRQAGLSVLLMEQEVLGGQEMVAKEEVAKKEVEVEKKLVRKGPKTKKFKKERKKGHEIAGQLITAEMEEQPYLDQFEHIEDPQDDLKVTFEELDLQSLEMGDTVQKQEVVVLHDEYEDGTKPDLQIFKSSDQKEARPIICNYNDMKCGKRFKKQTFLDKHIQKYHVNNTLSLSERMVVCSLCGVNVKKKHEWHHKTKNHGTKKKCQYDGCGFESLYRKCFRDHNKRVHLKLPKSTVCSECGKAFYTVTEMNRHVKADHLGEKPYTCEQCGKTFARYQHLWGHRQVHATTTRYNCNVCGKGFRGNGALWNHRKLHERGRAVLQGRPGHIPAPGGGLRCGGCIGEVVVAGEEEMEAHMREHHPPGQPFWCDQCNYSFLEEELVIAHNTKYHSSQGSKKRRYKQN